MLQRLIHETKTAVVCVNNTYKCIEYLKMNIKSRENVLYGVKWSRYGPKSLYTICQNTSKQMGKY